MGNRFDAKVLNFLWL